MGKVGAFRAGFFPDGPRLPKEIIDCIFFSSVLPVQIWGEIK